MYTLYKFHFLNGISEKNQLFDDILIIWPAPVYIYIFFLLIFFFLWVKYVGQIDHHNTIKIDGNYYISYIFYIWTSLTSYNRGLY